MSAYLANYDSWTKIAESFGTIQNADALCDLGLKVEWNNPPDNDVWNSTLHPRELQPFDLRPYADAELFIRCLDRGRNCPARVIAARVQPSTKLKGVSLC